MGPSSNINPTHAAFGVTGAGSSADRDRGGDAVDIRWAERDTRCGEIFFQPGDVLGAGDRDHVRTLRQQPGEHQLPRGTGLLLIDGLDTPEELPVLAEGLRGKA